MALFCSLTLTPVLLAQMGGGGGFGGPSVMGRGGQAGRRGGESVRLRGFVAADGIYDSGLTTFSREGVLGAQGAAGIETRWGGYGSKSYRRSAVGLDYQGDYRNYANVSSWNGSSQTLSLSYSAQPYRRASFELSTMAGSTNRAFGVNTPSLGAFGSNAVNQVAVPTASFFDIRTNYFGGTGGATLVHSARLSTSYMGSGFTVRRKNRLPGVDGVIGRADVNYRVGKRTTVGADVSYYKFDYTNAFGDTNVIDPGILFSTQLGRSLEVGMRVGIMRVESFGVKLVDFEPEIAALLGVGQTSEIFYLRTYQPSGGAQVLRKFKRGNITGSAQITPSPGNGLLFASRQLTVNGGGYFSVSRRLSVNINTGLTRLRSVTSLTGSFQQYNFGGGISYKFNRSLELLSRVDRRVAQLTTGSSIGLNGTRLSVGLAFSPSDVPLQLW